MKSNKVFGLGLSRTGTMSLNTALNTIGIISIHYPHDAVTQKELKTGAGKLTILRAYQGITDISVVPWYKRLDTAYPGSKFILTVRRLEPWLDSVQAHMRRLEAHQDEMEARFWSFTRFICDRVYGGFNVDRQKLSQSYIDHFRDVKAYFADRSKDLLIMDITESPGWVPLCEFLERPVPDQAFPHNNQGS